MPSLCDPPPGLPDQEEPRRLLAGRLPPPLSPPTRHYRPRSNKVTTKGGGARFEHPWGPVGREGGRWGLIMQPTGNKTHRGLKKRNKNITGGSCCCFQSQQVFKGLSCSCWTSKYKHMTAALHLGSLDCALIRVAWVAVLCFNGFEGFFFDSVVITSSEIHCEHKTD